jgi:FtsZ-binding cell division protein ZapB
MASGYQFAHIQTFSSKGNSANRSYSDVLMENGRTPGNSPHVSEPGKPNLIWGTDPFDCIPIFEKRILDCKAKLRGTGKRFQNNTHVMEGAVFSHPMKSSQLEIASEEEIKSYLQWRTDMANFAIKDAKSRGLEVLSVVEHLDEPYPHIHVISIPLITEDNPRCDAKRCHDGHRASEIARKKTLESNSGLPSKEANKSAVNAGTAAFKKAMQDWQDKVYNEVSVKHGLTRIGPARARLPRDAWLKTKQFAEQLVNLTKKVGLKKEEFSEVKNKIDTMLNTTQAVYSENKTLSTENKALSNDSQRLAGDVARLQKENEALKSTVSALNLKYKQDLKVMSDRASQEIERLEEQLNPRILGRSI